MKYIFKVQFMAPRDAPLDSVFSHTHQLFSQNKEDLLYFTAKSLTFCPSHKYYVAVD